MSNGELEDLICGQGPGDPQSEELSFREEEQNSKDNLKDLDDSKLVIIPNPVSRGNNLEILLNYSEDSRLVSSSKKKALVSIYDSSGRLVHNINDQALLEGNQYSENTFSFNFNSSALSSGLYTLVLTLSDSGKVKVGRFIIQ